MSSDAETTTCPECETEQPESAPFCQNCGYRMRSPKTVREPIMDLSSSEPTQDDGPTSTNRPPRTERSQDSTSTDESASSPTRRMIPAPGGTSDTTGANGAVGDAGSTEPSGNADDSPDTVIEGMKAVPTDTDDNTANRRTDSESDGVSATSDSNESVARQPTTGRIPIDDQRTRIRWTVGGAVAACVAVVFGLSWLHLERQSSAESDSTATDVDEKIIDIEAGPFRRGLSEDAEAFILDFCYRYHDDPEQDCDRERLLSGEYPEQTVEMPAYRIDAIPVRNADYDQCVDDGACAPLDDSDCAIWTPRGLQPGLRAPDILRSADRPVVCVEREDAQDYCEYRGGQLPTHNQWEKAARGDGAPLFPWGDRWQPDRANWGETDIMRVSVAGEIDGFAWTSPPGAFPEGTSPYGVHDMAGNVAEWVRGNDPMIGQVRGGSWVSNPFELRTTVRKDVDADARRSDVGFRCTYPADG